MLIRSVFSSDVTRDIPPVVYFHEQNPERLQDEVSEYIVTGGWPEGDPRRARVQHGIHEQLVRLLTGLSAAIERKGGPELPASWISGFYGSGKSSFAKLLGLALDGVVLPDGTPLAEAWLARDTTPRRQELVEAWQALRSQIDPLAVVFDIGAVARDDENIHGAIVRRVQVRLGYSADSRVADYELKLERAGKWPQFQEAAAATLGVPWSEMIADPLVDDHFSRVLSVLMPETFRDPMSWVDARAGTETQATSVEDAVRALDDMLKRRAPGKTLFLVIDEISQYVNADANRMLALQTLVQDLGSRLRGRAWLLVTGQQKLEDQADASVLGKLKDRFPPRLRVHLDNQNIRDVVHRRLLQKTAEATEQLRALYARHRPALALYAYEGAAATPDDFADVYPLLPGHIDLLLRITTELRTRSSRAQGDDHTIRGLLQLLGELFRERALAQREVGALVTLDEVYEVQHTALDGDLQTTMGRILTHCAEGKLDLAARAAKAVALLQLLQERMPTSAELVAQCLYDRLDRGNQLDEVHGALDGLRAAGLLTFTERHGYAIQSSAGEEWEHERASHSAPVEERTALMLEQLTLVLGDRKENPKHQGRPFPVAALVSDGRRLSDHVLLDPRDRACLTFDLRLLPAAEAQQSTWLRRSEEGPLRDRLIWICSEVASVDDAAAELARSKRMVERYQARRDSLTPARGQLLVMESSRQVELQRALRERCEQALFTGRVYFRANEWRPRDFGGAVIPALLGMGTRALPELFPYSVSINVLPAELAQLLVPGELSGISPKFQDGELGLVEVKDGRIEVTCPGLIPRRVLEFIERERGVSGATLLAQFGGPPYGYTASVIRAALAALLRARRIRIRTDDDVEVIAIRDLGVRDLFEKDAPLRKAVLYPAGAGTVTPQMRNRMARLFNPPVDRDSDVIAEAIAKHFPGFIQRTREVVDRLRRLPGPAEAPAELTRLLTALEEVFRRVRHTDPALTELARHIDTISDGLQRLGEWGGELSDETIGRLVAAHRLSTTEAAQLSEARRGTAESAAATAQLAAAMGRSTPWRALSEIEAAGRIVRTTYVSVRTQLLGEQEALSDEARARVKALPGFEKLSGEQSHHVLRPLREARSDTTAEATSPPLRTLGDGFREVLRRAEEEAVARLDEIRFATERRQVVRVDLGLRNRELGSAEDVEALIREIRQRLLEQVATGAKIRLV